MPRWRRWQRMKPCISHQPSLQRTKPCASIHVDPARIGDCDQRLQQMHWQPSPVCEGVAGDGFRHNSDWTTLACEDIRRERFAIVRLPTAYAGVYRRLLLPSAYPAEMVAPVSGASEAAEARKAELPAELVRLLHVWTTICEVCARSSRAPYSIGSPCTAHRQPRKHAVACCVSRCTASCHPRPVPTTTTRSSHSSGRATSRGP